MTATDRRIALTSLAGDVLEAVGLERFGVGELARAAGIKPPSLYKHFDGIADVEAALIAEAFREFGAALAHADGARGFAQVYRAYAATKPQRYRLMTARPLDRERLSVAEDEVAAMLPLLRLLGEDVDHHPRSRALWAWAHGLIVLEIADRYPPGADLDASWDVLIDTAERWASEADRRP